MATINYTLKGTANPSPIYIRLKDGRAVDVMAKTNYNIDPKHWSKDKQRPKPSDDYLKKLGSDMVHMASELLKHYNSRAAGQTINTQWLKDFINPPQEHAGASERLADFIETYKAHNKQLSPASIIKYNTLKGKIERYEKHIKRPLLIKDINAAFQTSFTNFLQSESFADNTIARDIRFIKTLCRNAKLHGIETHAQLDALSGVYKKVDSIYLTFEEIELIKKAKLLPHLDNARDWLVISCYTGQRISDFMRFDKSMIRYQKNRSGKKIALIEFTQKKTGQIMTIPLHDEVMKVLEKNGGNFPRRISDVKYNEYIKTVCDDTGIREKVKGARQVEQGKDTGIYRKEEGEYFKFELVTSHIGRRSFATNFYGKIPTPLLTAITGHSTEKMFLTYIGKSDSDRALEASEWF